MGVAEQQPGHRLSLRFAVQPDHPVASPHGPLEQLSVLRLQRGRGEGTALGDAVRDEVGERVRRHRGVRPVTRQSDLDLRRGFRCVTANLELGTKALGRCRDRDVLQQGAQGNLARAPLQVVDAPFARVEAVDHEAVFAEQLEPPRLRVVAAGRPAGEVEYALDRAVGRGDLGSRFRRPGGEEPLARLAQDQAL